MTASVVGVGAATAGGTTSVSPAWPVGYTAVADDWALVLVASGHTTVGTRPACSGYYTLGSITGGAGTFGSAAGPRRWTVFLKRLTTSEAAPTVTLATGNVLMAHTMIVRPTTGNLLSFQYLAVAEGTNNASITQAMLNKPSLLVTGDLAIIGVITNDAVTFTAQNITASSLTHGTVTEHVDANTTTGNDVSITTASCTVTASATAAATVSTTASGSTSGVVGVVSVREWDATAQADYTGYDGTTAPGTTFGTVSNFTDAANALTVGCEFVCTEANVTYLGVKVWNHTGTQTDTSRLWDTITAGTGNLITAANDSAAASSAAWNQILLDTPVALTKGTRYRVGVNIPTNYSSIANYWDTGQGMGGDWSGPIFRPNTFEAVGNDQNPFIAAATTYPTGVFNATSYLVVPIVRYTPAGQSVAVGVAAGTVTAATITRNPYRRLIGAAVDTDAGAVTVRRKTRSLVVAAQTTTATAVAHARRVNVVAPINYHTAVTIVPVQTGGAFNPPTGVVATPVNPYSVLVTWGLVSGASGYDVLRSRWDPTAGGGSGAWVDEAVIASDAATNSYTDNLALPATKYRYCIKAVRYEGAGTYTDFYHDLYGDVYA